MLIILMNAGNNDDLKKPLIDFANSQTNCFLIVGKFKENPIVDESELLKYMFTLHKYEDLVFYLWSDPISVNRMVVCVNHGPIESKVIACIMVKSDNHKDNKFLFRIDDQDNKYTCSAVDKSLLSKLDAYIARFI
jgi:hypothetical protein